MSLCLSRSVRHHRMKAESSVLPALPRLRCSRVRPGCSSHTCDAAAGMVYNTRRQHWVSHQGICLDAVCDRRNAVRVVLTRNFSQPRTASSKISKPSFVVVYRLSLQRCAQRKICPLVCFSTTRCGVENKVPLLKVWTLHKRENNRIQNKSPSTVPLLASRRSTLSGPTDQTPTIGLLWTRHGDAARTGPHWWSSHHRPPRKWRLRRVQRFCHVLSRWAVMRLLCRIRFWERTKWNTHEIRTMPVSGWSFAEEEDGRRRNESGTNFR